MKKAFTVIELLLVVAIIGLLSSIVLVSVKSLRSRATVVSGLQFESNIQHGFGVYSQGSWDFNDGSGGTAKDSSGNGNTCAITSATWSSDTPSKEGYSLDFNAGNSLDCGLDSSLDFLTIPGYSKYTWTFWVKKDQNGVRYAIVGKGYDGAQGFGIFITEENKVDFFNNMGDSCLSLGSIGTDWTHVAVSYDGTYIMFYINGKYDNKGGVVECLAGYLLGDPPDLSPGAPREPYLIARGSYYGVWYGLSGLLDDVRVYSEALTARQIENIYVEDAVKKGLAVE